MKNYDELYVISDLHLGGETGFQIFDQRDELIGLIELLRIAPKDSKIGLVLNGDIVDFLAEPNSSYFDPIGVDVKLKRIFEQDQAFKDIFKKLAEYVKTDNRDLILVLGNHDIELALPAAKEYFLNNLCGNSLAAQSRIIFATDGAGFKCEIQGREVLCLHGNEVDNWNTVDYNQLLEVIRALNRNNPIPEWNPNAGTKLVIDIMNDIKRRQPFVDLLKPETRAVPSVLFATEKTIKDKLFKLSPVLLQLSKDKVRKHFGLLSSEETSDQSQFMDSNEALHALLQPGFLSSELKISNENDIDQLFRQIERRYQTGETGNFEDMHGTLGEGGLFLDRILKRDPVENLRETLVNWIGSDPIFNFDFEDKDTFQPLDQYIGPNIDFIVAGHTHLHRSLKRKNGVGAYFNSGSWIRLIKIETEILENTETFRPFYEILRSPTMKQLDESGIVIRRPTVVSIKAVGNKVVGQLNIMSLDSDSSPKLIPIEKSQREV